MNIIGIDPGSKTFGWCELDTETRAVRGWETNVEGAITWARVVSNDVVVIELPVAQGPTRPDVVEASRWAGVVEGILLARGPAEPEVMRRIDVRKTLTEATHGTIHVKNDATAWQALCELWGKGSDKKPKKSKGKVVEAGGPLGEVKGHARAALAVAVAWAISNGHWRKA